LYCTVLYRSVETSHNSQTTGDLGRSRSEVLNCWFGTHKWATGMLWCSATLPISTFNKAYRFGSLFHILMQIQCS